jgi:hypothetical protein
MLASAEVIDERSDGKTIKGLPEMVNAKEIKKGYGSGGR